jgi:hypothetical protein
VTARALSKASDIADTLGKSTDCELWAKASKLLNDNSDRYFTEDKGSLIKGFLHNQRR